MGADTFIAEASGATTQQAFSTAVDDALYSHGHGGYTGSMAEKQSFITIPLPEGTDAVAEANRLIDNDDPRISDKWGPAGAYDLGDGRYLFFGWASS